MRRSGSTAGIAVGSITVALLRAPAHAGRAAFRSAGRRYQVKVGLKRCVFSLQVLLCCCLPHRLSPHEADLREEAKAT